MANGVKADDHPAMSETVKTVGMSLDGEDVTVDIVDKEKLMNAEEIKLFDSLSVKDRLLVVLNVLGYGDVQGMGSTALSNEAKALSDAVAARVDSLVESERNALLNTLYGHFLPRLIVIDGQEYEALGIEIIIDRNGEKIYERYTFYKDGDEWKLYRIEKGEYIVVEP